MKIKLPWEDRLKKIVERDYWLIKRRPWLKKLIITLVTVCFLSIFPIILGIGVGYWYMYHYSGCFFDVGCLTTDKGEAFDLEKLARSDFKQASYNYADNGEVIGIFFDEIRDVVRIEQVPKVIKDAFISAEDKRFYNHSGVDVIATASAAFGNATRKLGFKVWAREGGASSITQQLARLLYAEEAADFRNRSYTYSRKLKEARLAIQLEKRYTKNEIFEGYLNLIWLGHGANGVAAGMERYWGKNIRKDEPTIQEAAILAAINKNPSIYDPLFREPVEPKIKEGDESETAKKLEAEYKDKFAEYIIEVAIKKDRYNFVLEQMLSNGYISVQEFEENKFLTDENPDTALAELRSWKKSGYGYSNRIIKEMLLTSGYTEEQISEKGGLRVYTTLNTRIQQIATEEFEKQLAFINQEKSLENKVNGAFVIIDVKTGDIKAMTGGNNFDESQYNRVMALRSPGSGFKPFVYAAAMEKGMGFYDRVCNCPFRARGGNGKVWAPQNFREKNPQPLGYIDLARGVIWSLNLETLNLARTIGMEAVISQANKMGIQGNPGLVRDSRGEIWFRRPRYQIKGGLDPLLPSAIGASGVNLIEIANAYAVFARGGMYMRPNLIKQIKDSNGDIIYKAEPSYQERVLSQDSADKMTALMRVVTKIGTLKISGSKIKQQVACKTGTSDGPRDLGIYCFTPDYVMVIRLGHDNYSPVDLPEYMRKVSGDPNMQVSGGWVVGPLLKIFDRIYENRPDSVFSEAIEAYKEELLERYN